ncbi:MAG: MBL fold metallo-hydrolase [Candidatus Methylacidiphilales bacterium]|nr:MBL fold metallo-hydrolase [Candidatus Methylacidiphilales bacterium]
MNLPLEDAFSDILGKAFRGLGLGTEGMEGLLSGKWDAPAAEAACRKAGLDFPALREIAQGLWQPRPVALPGGLAMFTTPFGDMTVNAYLAWDETTREAAAFDTGADATQLLRKLETGNLKLETLFLTHTHGDHVLDMDRLVERTGCRVRVSRLEPFVGAEPFEPGITYKVGRLDIESRPTPGHSPGGTSYAIHGLGSPVMIVGDALFAGSVGGIKSDYAGSLHRIREQILGGQENTILCPGHGPVTTVGEEKKHNPFFA